MTVKSTLFAKRKSERTRKARLREQGLCVDCCGNPATLNADGTQSIRCTECRRKAKHPIRRPGLAAAPAPRPIKLYDETDEKTFYNDAAFHAYRELVRKAIERQGTATIGSIHTELGDGTRREWTQAAIDTLDIESFQYGSRQGYRIKTYRQMPMQIDSAKHNEYRRWKAIQGRSIPDSSVVFGV